MKTDLVHSMTDNFEAHAQETEGGIEFWLASDLQYLPGYTKWDNFLSEHDVSDHFSDVGKMVDPGLGSQREVDDIMLNRYACRLMRWARSRDRKRIRSGSRSKYLVINNGMLLAFRNPDDSYSD